MADDRKPNIVFFFTDDQRFDTIAALGNEQVHTPAMDWLVEGGLSFTQACIMGGTSGAVCMPSRAMLNTGRTLFHIDGVGKEVPPGHTLLGEMFQAAGYETFGTGKWHNGTDAYARSFTCGDEIFFGGMADHWNMPSCRFDPDGKYDRFYPSCRDAFSSNDLRWNRGDHVTPGKHSSELLAEAAAEFVREYEQEKPFYLYLSFLAPHDPRTMPEKFREMYDPDEIDLPPNFLPEHPFDKGHMRNRDEMLEDFPRTPEAVRKHIAEYYGMISHLDAQMQMVIDALREKGELENTVFVFAGDNGLAVGQHGLMGKQSVYEHSVRVPLVFRGPGIPEGQQSETLAYLIDIFPTLCEMIGSDIPDSVEGKSLVPVWKDGQPLRDSQYLAYTWFQRGLRDGRWKLIENVVDGERTTQLFNLVEDPWETKNLAGQVNQDRRLATLRKRMIEWRDQLDEMDSEFGRTFWSAWE
ncbi:MAG: sulfatase-like hydrolase/transferase [Phycisphaerae bacterium]